MNATIIILALIAAFLGLRLYSALGKHGNPDQKPALPGAEDGPRSAGPVAVAPVNDASGGGTGFASEGLVYEPAAEIGIRAILQADRNFDVGRFLAGSQAAYRLILEAFWSGDRAALRDLCDADSCAAFVEAIEAREARGETLDNRLVSIERAVIIGAALNHGVAQIVVRFTADIAAITRDSNNAMIAGSITDAVTTTDVWSFVRPVASRDPNWLLDATDAG